MISIIFYVEQYYLSFECSITCTLSVRLHFFSKFCISIWKEHWFCSIQLQQGVDSEISKPDPRLFLQACQSLGVKPASSLMVGDSAGDIEMAKGAGAAGCIGICWGKPEASHLQGADIAIASLDEMEIV